MTVVEGAGTDGLDFERMPGKGRQGGMEQI